MEYDHYALVNGNSINKDVRCTFSVSNPLAWNDAGKPDISKFDKTEPLWDLPPYDTEYSFNELLNILKDEKKREMIATNCDWKNCPIELDNPTPHDMLHLAQDIHFTIGLYQ